MTDESLAPMERAKQAILARIALGPSDIVEFYKLAGAHVQIMDNSTRDKLRSFIKEHGGSLELPPAWTTPLTDNRGTLGYIEPSAYAVTMESLDSAKQCRWPVGHFNNENPGLSLCCGKPTIDRLGEIISPLIKYYCEEHAFDQGEKGIGAAKPNSGMLGMITARAKTKHYNYAARGSRAKGSPRSDGG